VLLDLSDQRDRRFVDHRHRSGHEREHHYIGYIGVGNDVHNGPHRLEGNCGLDDGHHYQFFGLVGR
jgi:hypothetical protein